MENTFVSKEAPPKECANPACQYDLDGLEIVKINETKNKAEKQEEINKDNEKISGLKLIYQKTFEEISIKAGVKVVLGRTNYGKKVLGKIDQVSRTHCSIEFKDNHFIVTDLGSTNGTFVGLGNDKTDCKTPQILNDKDFLVLGREVFLAQYLTGEKQEQTKTIGNETDKSKIPEKILCIECSCELKELPCICPECGTWNE